MAQITPPRRGRASRRKRRANSQFVVQDEELSDRADAELAENPLAVILDGVKTYIETMADGLGRMAKKDETDNLPLAGRKNDAGHRRFWRSGKGHVPFEGRGQRLPQFLKLAHRSPGH